MTTFEFVDRYPFTLSARLERSDARELAMSLPKESIDFIITSPPYFVGKEYDRSNSIVDFTNEIKRVMPSFTGVLKNGGSLCWQIGHHVNNGRIVPLDAIIISRLMKSKRLFLRNRIIWTFGHGAHASKRFSGRHESIVWYTKGEEYYFDLDGVRIIQKYPGKRHYKGPQKGSWSGNPNGKNPGDVWEIPNVKAKHIEKTAHPCQFPVALAARLVRALCPEGGTVFDPYVGSGTAAIAAIVSGRNFVGGDIEQRYLDIAEGRLSKLQLGTEKIRPDRPVRVPQVGESVSQVPPHFKGKNEVLDAYD